MSKQRRRKVALRPPLTFRERLRQMPPDDLRRALQHTAQGDRTHAADRLLAEDDREGAACALIDFCGSMLPK